MIEIARAPDLEMDLYTGESREASTRWPVEYGNRDERQIQCQTLSREEART